MSAQSKPFPSLARPLAAAILLATGVLVLAGAPSAAAHSATLCINNNPNSVTLYGDANYLGRCSIKGIGEYLNSGVTDLPNDSLSSIEIGANVRVMLCRNAGFGGCETLTASDNRLSDNWVGNDSVSSLRVYRHSDPPWPTRCAPGPWEFAVYEHAWFEGSCAIHGTGWGGFPNHDSLGLLNDSISSIRAGSKVYELKLCRDGDYGRCSTYNWRNNGFAFVASMPRLSDLGLNDTISSMDAASIY